MKIIYNCVHKIPWQGNNFTDLFENIHIFIAQTFTYSILERIWMYSFLCLDLFAFQFCTNNPVPTFSEDMVLFAILKEFMISFSWIMYTGKVIFVHNWNWLKV
mmetsp:Transcript_27349/g.27727  ORF Transcript_27349/g.27727 Transcript_27349/m.27727 type:complete len:103 (-) Transcript_27349:307-615(-)